MEFPIDFKKCPHCGAEEPIAQTVCADEPSIAKGTFFSLEKKITPVQDFLRISTPTTKILLRHYDTCYKCGRDYCTRIEKTTMPTDALMKMMGMVP